MITKKTVNRLARKRRIRAKISGTLECPRMSVYRSLTQITVQLIDDDSKRTLVCASTKEAKITSVVFDRNAYAFHGTVKALADSAREGGLKF